MTLDRSRLSFVLVVAVLPFAMGGCSEDETPSADERPPATSATPPADPTAYCRAVFDLTAASNEDLGFSPETATKREIREGTMAWYASEKATALMQEAVATAPAGLADDTRVLVSGLAEFAETGDVRTVGRTIRKSQGRIDRYLEQECPGIVG